MSTPKLLRRIDVFVSSPGDCGPEREIVMRVVERLNRLAYVRERYYLKVLTYEDIVPPVVGTSPQQVVDDYMMKAEHSDLLICVMWARMGTPVAHPQTGEMFDSGTEYEFTTAYRANQKLGKPYILLYQKAAPAPDAEPEQNAKVHAFFKRFEGKEADFRGLYRRYTTLEQFEELIFEHIELVIARNLIQQGPMVDAHVLPQLQEETRRLDAAMPDETKVNRPTEVWVQICMPSSEGFRGKLPAYTKTSREQITQRDVRAGNLAIAFPINPQTGLPEPIRVWAELRADDFTIEESRIEIMLSPRMDSGMLVFNLTPKVARERSIVHISVRQKMPDGGVITLGSTALSTRIHGPNALIAVAQVAWNLLSIPLAAVELHFGPKVYQSASADEEATERLMDEIFSNEDDEVKEQAKPAAPPAPAPTPAPIERQEAPILRPMVPPQPAQPTSGMGSPTRDEKRSTPMPPLSQPGTLAQPAPAPMPSRMQQSPAKRSRGLAPIVLLAILVVIIAAIVLVISLGNPPVALPTPGVMPTSESISTQQPTESSRAIPGYTASHEG